VFVPSLPSVAMGQRSGEQISFELAPTLARKKVEFAAETVQHIDAVIRGGRVTRRPVEAPTGAFVVCAEVTQPFTVRVLNAHGDVLAEIEEQAGS
jgi:hypothetical protein